MTPHVYKHHPWTRQRKQSGPVRVADGMAAGNAVQRLNARIALKITAGVGTMWCAYIFALYVLLALPQALKNGTYGIVQIGRASCRERV